MTRILIMRLPFPTKMKKKNRKNLVKGGGWWSESEREIPRNSLMILYFQTSH